MKTETLTRQQLDQMDHEELVEAYMATQKNVRELESEVGLLKEELGQIKAMMFSRKSEKKEDIPEEQISFEFNEIETVSVEEPAEEAPLAPDAADEAPAD